MLSKSAKLLSIPEILEKITPCSEPGKKLKSKFIPFAVGSEKNLSKEYSKINSLIAILKNKPSLASNLNSDLAKIENIKQTFNKAELAQYELFEVKKFLFYYERIRNLLKDNNIPALVKLPSFAKIFSELDLEKQNTPTFHLSSKYSKELRDLRDKISSCYAEMERMEKEILGLAKKELAVAKIEKQIVVSRNNIDLISKLNKSKYYILVSENFANLSYSIKKNDNILAIERDIDEINSAIEKEERIICSKLSKLLSLHSKRLVAAIDEIAVFDLLLAKALFGIRNNCCIPKIISHPLSKDNCIVLEQAVNLPIRNELNKNDIDYQAINLTFHHSTNIITGINMGGKSTLLKTIGQLFSLSSYAIPLPCSSAQIPLVDFIFFSSDAESSQRTDLSSFASELIAINEAFKMKGTGLFLIDEFARGTNPQEGNAFAQAVIKKFSKGILFSATHFSAVTKISNAAHYRIKGFSKRDFQKMKEDIAKTIGNDENQLILRIKKLHKYMNYELEEDKKEPPKAALMIAQILGIDDEIINFVENYLSK